MAKQSRRGGMGICFCHKKKLVWVFKVSQNWLLVLATPPSVQFEDGDNSP